MAGTTHPTSNAGASPNATSRVNGVVRHFLFRAREELDEAARSHDPRQAFLSAHLAALKVAGALIEGSPTPARRRTVNAWDRLERLGEPWVSWAMAFRGYSSLRQAIEGDYLAFDAPVPGAEYQELVASFLDEATIHLRGDVGALAVAS